MISPACVMNQMHAGMHKAAQGHEQKAGLLHPRFRSMQRRAVSRAGRPYTKAFGTKEMSLSSVGLFPVNVSAVSGVS
jgi:hypothetical protein